MTSIRRNLIRRGIAEVINDCAPYYVPQDTAFKQLNLTLRPAASLGEFEEVFNKMETDRQIRTQRDDDGVLKARLTDEGKDLLR